MTALTLSAVEVGEVLGYRAEQVRRLARDGRIPGPIDATLNPKLWRWSRAEIIRYVNGPTAESDFDAFLGRHLFGRHLEVAS